MSETKGEVSHNEEIAPAEHGLAAQHTLDAEDIKGRDFTMEEDELPEGYFLSANFIGSMFAIGASFGCGVGSFGFVAPVLGLINADIGPDANLTWVALAYLLTSSIGFVIVGRLTDIFGRRWFFIGGGILAVLGSIVCATAPNINALIAGETLLGLAASVQLSYACKLERRSFRRICGIILTCC